MNNIQILTKVTAVVYRIIKVTATNGFQSAILTIEKIYVIVHHAS
jgi:hypothetical protein